jgi:hypothetical protein
MPTLQQLLQPTSFQKTVRGYTLRIDGPLKSGKTTLALTASTQCPHPSKWDPKKPVEITDMLWIMTEKGALEYAQNKGIHVKNVLDWSDEGLTIGDLQPAIQALPAAAEQYRAAGVKTVVWDTLSTTQQRLVRDCVNPEPEAARMKAYGRVNEKHFMIFDALQGMKMNVIGLVHIINANVVGEDGKNEAFAKLAAAQVDKLEAMSVAGFRPDFIPVMQAKAAAHWGRMSNQVLGMDPALVTIRAGVKEVQYKFVATPGGELAVGGRWDLQGTHDAYLRPHLEKFYGTEV